jgi:hypothetical protein
MRHGSEFEPKIIPDAIEAVPEWLRAVPERIVPSNIEISHKR